MRILLIHNQYRKKGGEDVVLENEYRLLKQHGHHVQKLLFNNHHLKPFRLLWELFYNISSAKKLSKIIKEFEPQIIHIHNLFYVASPSILDIAHKNNIPVIMTLHNYRLICSNAMLLRDQQICELCTQKVFPLSGIRYSCHGSRLKTFFLTSAIAYHKLIKTWKNKVAKYIVLTEFAKRKILYSSLNLNKDQIIIKPNFVEDMGLTPHHERQDFFLFIGRLSKEKGIDLLLDMAKKTSANIEMIGTGDYEKTVRSLSEKFPNITFWGFKDKNFIINKLKTCKALVFPSIWYEGLPMTILEAFSTGTPVIASDIGNLNTIIQDNINGLLFKAHNTTDLGRKLLLFNESPDKVIPLYQGAYLTFTEKYTAEKNYEELINSYADLLK